MEAISVGATLSATDPVTILAIFTTYKVDPKLYTIIFGESILNDAIAIVLFETAQKYKPGSGSEGNLSVIKLFEAAGVFTLVFFGSLVIGVVVGVVTALMLKYTMVRRYPKIESCLVILIAYASYFFSNGCGMSGKLFDLVCCPQLIVYRHRVSLILWHHLEALRLLQHVSSDAANNKISIPSICAIDREFHLHLPGVDPIYQQNH